MSLLWGVFLSPRRRRGPLAATGFSVPQTRVYPPLCRIVLSGFSDWLPETELRSNRVVLCQKVPLQRMCNGVKEEKDTEEKTRIAGSNRRVSTTPSLANPGDWTRTASGDVSRSSHVAVRKLDAI